MPRQNRVVEGLIPGSCKIRKRGCSSSSSSVLQNYQFKRAILVGKPPGSRSSTPVPSWRTTAKALDSRKYAPSQSSGGRSRPVSARKLISTFLHACKGDAVTKLTNEKIPYFNAPIYLQNKTQIGKVEEIFGPINESDMLPILTELRHALDMQVALENHVEEGNFFKQEKLSKLWDILAAYAWFDIDVGYCQVFKQFLCPITDEILEQAYFNAPDGDEPLALDMGSMGKGQVWINGQSIGRYWTAFATGNCNGHGEYGTRSLCLIKHKADAW
ncbi:hypothetical protein ACSBR2_022640 [Camellia fascicularis]